MTFLQPVKRTNSLEANPPTSLCSATPPSTSLTAPSPSSGSSQYHPPEARPSSSIAFTGSALFRQKANPGKDPFAQFSHPFPRQSPEVLAETIKAVFKINGPEGLHPLEEYFPHFPFSYRKAAALALAEQASQDTQAKAMASNILDHDMLEWFDDPKAKASLQLALS